MLLALNVGNSQTDIGVMSDGQLVRHWRVSTAVDRTADEYLLLLRGLLNDQAATISRAALASVVPAVSQALGMALGQLVDSVLTVGPGVKTGMPMSVDNPREVGADRVATAVAAKQFYGQPVIVVGFGTAITVDVVGGDGAFVGGAITSGIEVALDALVDSTAALRRVALTPPVHVIGRNTIEAIQSGMVYGFAGLVDGLVERALDELGADAVLVATGSGVATLVPLLAREYVVDDVLALRGLGLLSERNR
ncbi:MAG: type III pantothenate kinase [Acidimicrobiia bacterium]|nr:type III pantothenate kinase [Acidimicrobiia bacterium]MDH5504783.1 type III pantothenate kinase [Acidimicrobiia bacterium]